jgi:hypothetical protein
MGSITRGLSNNITTGGVILPTGITNASVSAVTSFANASGGTLTLLSTQTASNSASLSFTTGLDSTYDAYEFKFIDIHPRGNGVDFSFQGSTNGGSSYGIAMTTTQFRAYHDEADTATQLAYNSVGDLAQSTTFQMITGEITVGDGADECCVGYLQLFNPSSTTYVKHFIIDNQTYNVNDYCARNFIGGYFNTTSAINAIQFKMTSGNFDGVIKLYGLKKS